MDKLFSFSGRAKRSEWWIITIALIVVNILVITAALGPYYEREMNKIDYAMTYGTSYEFTAASYPWWAWVFFLAAAVIGLAAHTRRWHDLGKSGWWYLITLIPIIGGLYALVQLGFIEGDHGPNQYGAAPGTATQYAHTSA